MGFRNVLATQELEIFLATRELERLSTTKLHQTAKQCKASSTTMLQFLTETDGCCILHMYIYIYISYKEKITRGIQRVSYAFVAWILCETVLPGIVQEGPLMIRNLALLTAAPCMVPLAQMEDGVGCG